MVLACMNPEDYDGWYDTPRGRWIGNTEVAWLNELLASRTGESLLDVGYGTGWFTRRFAALN
jgi:ubiquinone/menaquinone biosynthesis C-methylase UbiE